MSMSSSNCHMWLCRSTSVSNLMYVKEDLVLPHNLSFYELIISKARGKSGPLFAFDVYEDVRLEHNANVEKEESHAGKAQLMPGIGISRPCKQKSFYLSRAAHDTCCLNSFCCWYCQFCNLHFCCLPAMSFCTWPACSCVWFAV